MAALAVVERLDVFEDRAPRRGAGRPAVPIQQVELEGGEEALGDRIVLTVGGPAQAGPDAVLSSTLVYASDVN